LEFWQLALVHAKFVHHWLPTSQAKANAFPALGNISLCPGIMPNLTFNELYSIADALATGFQELSRQVDEQQKIEQKLILRLERATEKVRFNFFL
jgi:hypothetical protein